MQRELAKVQNEDLWGVPETLCSISVLENEAQVPPIELVLEKVTVLDNKRWEQGMTGKQTIELFLQKDKKRATKKSRQRRNALEQPNCQPGRDGDTRKLGEMETKMWELQGKTSPLSPSNNPVKSQRDLEEEPAPERRDNNSDPG